MGHLNVEIKARCSDQRSIRAYLQQHRAEFRGVDHQVDTYFVVSRGRLKLREGNIENYLVYYERTNTAGPKESAVTLYAVDPASNFKEILAKALDVLVVVDKQREIFFVDNVKFHIDVVEGLGSFVEIEAIDKTGTIGTEKLLEQCQFYLKEFGILDKDLIAESYSDLLAQGLVTA